MRNIANTTIKKLHVLNDHSIDAIDSGVATSNRVSIECMFMNTNVHLIESLINLCIQHTRAQ